MVMLHAKLSPSSSERWLDCPASVKMSEGFPDEGSWEALEGTAAHELASIEASYAFGKINELQLFDQRDAWIRQNQETFDVKEISRYVDGYVEFLRSRFADALVVFIEKQVHTEETDVWGTADFIAVQHDRVDIVDLKYGKGVAVEAFDNPQIRIYGVGVLDVCVGLVMAGLLDNMPPVVGLTIYQPRLTGTTTEEMRSPDLMRWFNSVVRPGAEKVDLADPPFGPSTRACRWCPASGQCAPQAEAVFSAISVPPAVMSPEQLSEAMGKVGLVKAWVEALPEVARKKMLDGKPIPGWKLVRSNGIRKIYDQTGAIQTLIDLGFKAEDVATFKVKGIGELEKLVGVKELPVVLGPLLERTEGTIQVVKEGDARPEHDSNTEAARIFG